MLQRKLFVAFSLQPLDEEMNEHKKLQVIEKKSCLFCGRCDLPEHAAICPTLMTR